MPETGGERRHVTGATRAEDTVKITKRTVAAGAVGAVAASGLGLVLLGAPLASAAETGTGTSTTTGGRLQAIRDALAGLVGDGTLTQEQADTVASTLDSSDALRGGPGGHGGGRGVDLDAAAEAVGLSAEELRTALQADGATLASVAAEQGVAEQELVDALVADATERLAQAVADGRLTQEQADERTADLPARTAELVDRELPGGPGGPGGRGGGPRGGTGTAEGGTEGSTSAAA
ncbi:hypothetical protein GTQ99_20900 [Kineococcus sp. T13]|uniref:hypothetical protein n=1 Tax=Kineococcus vitellinus TaxID=2696565 RepID=UPI001411E53F|nr:hypothetical protein [Kineococcus vitellinus]NAZ77848.1 hypothetical protein [Kineococcus vitellinus]